MHKKLLFSLFFLLNTLFTFSMDLLKSEPNSNITVFLRKIENTTNRPYHIHYDDTINNKNWDILIYKQQITVLNYMALNTSFNKNIINESMIHLDNIVSVNYLHENVLYNNYKLQFNFMQKTDSRDLILLLFYCSFGQNCKLKQLELITSYTLKADAVYLLDLVIYNNTVGSKLLTYSYSYFCKLLNQNR